MLKGMTRFATLLAAVVAQGIGAARADVRELVDAGKISWSGSPAVIYLNADGTTADEATYSHLVLKYTQTGDAGSLTIADGVKAGARILLVGGGGAGGTSTSTTVGGAGGGGAGGFLDTTATLQPGTYDVVVGAGGPAAATMVAAEGEDGNNSTFGTEFIAHGGGGGGAQSLGRAGGSGGGGSANYSSAIERLAGGDSTASDGEQGHTGGLGAVVAYGGGGGGAGADGQAAASTKSKGGDGLASDIILDESGIAITYAGGGAGGRTKLTTAIAGGAGGGGSGGSTTVEAQAGTDGLGGGGGGSGTLAPGGKGGDGVVIIRITSAIETKIDVPSIDNIPYAGENIVAFDFGFAYKFVGGVTNATDLGTYEFQVEPQEGFEWKTGGTDAKTITWRIVKRAIDLPVVATDLVYTPGVDQIGVTVSADYATFCTFTDSSVTNATDAGVYSFTVRLNDTERTCWKDGTTRVISDAWQIAPIAVPVPVAKEGLVYTGADQNGFESLDLERYELTAGVTNATAGGAHAFTFSLLGNTADVKNYVWNTDPKTADDYSGEWTISAAENSIISLEIDGWKVGLTPNAPRINARFGGDTAVYKYGFGTSEESVATWFDDPNAVNAAGKWIVKADIAATDSWTAAHDICVFEMWDDPSAIYHDSAEIYVKGRAGATTTLEGFPVFVKISAARMPGFDYALAGNKCDGLLFVDEFGNLLPYEVETYDAAGESILWVKLAKLPPTGVTLTMYWNIKSGQSAPYPYSPKAVWSEYTGVWHFSESEGGAKTILDSTANGINGSANGNSLVAAGVVGNSRGRTDATGGSGNMMSVGAIDVLNTLTPTFTVSGWMMPTTLDWNWAYIFSRKESDAYVSWGVQLRSDGDNTLRIYSRGNKDDNNQRNLITHGGKFHANQWTKYDVVYTETTVSLYLDGQHMGTQDLIPGGPAVNGNLAFTVGGLNGGGHGTLKGYNDEVRLRKGTVDAEWIAMEYESIHDESFTTNSIVMRDGQKLNAWTKLPTMDKTTWDSKDTPGTITSMGSLLYGNVAVTIYSVYDETKTFESIADITEEGLYRATFYATDADDCAPISHSIDIRVVTSKPYSKIGGTSGDSGRILLMNRDTNATCPIDYQGYNDTRDTLNTYWTHVDAATDTNASSLQFNLQAGTESILKTKGGVRTLWHLVNCRHGNSFPKDVASGSLLNTQNYLPYSSTSKSFKSRALNVKQHLAGQIVMRNVVDAAVYSSCFTNGIGTIYFDAVNGWARRSEVYDNYKIVVEVCTNTVDGLEPTDENSFTVVEGTDEGGLPTITTNWYGKLEGQWVPAQIIPYRRDITDGNLEFEKEDATEELTLDIANGGTMDNFFRIVVPLDIHGAVRFRIRRASEVPHSGTGAFGPDEGGFILLDNIIASLPAMRGDLFSAGHFDETKSNDATLGWELAANVPYPSQKDESVVGRAKAEYYVNEGDGTAIDTSKFFSGAKVHYRWRYLNQMSSQWKSIDLDPGNGFKALSAFDLPGHPCDVEYWYEYSLQTPFYSYVDYSGLGKAIDYTEERGVITNRLASVDLPSGGTDWFFRVREGKSAFSGVDIVFARGEGAAEERVHMALVGNNSWRGFVQTREDQKGDLKYRFEAFDRQTEEYAEFAASTNFWFCNFENQELPISSSLAEGTTNDWSTVALDAVTGYVMFQIDDETKSITVVHADYQNFNLWSDALNCKDNNGRSPIFVGTSTKNAYKIGVSPMKQTFSEDFSTWLTMPATNTYWQVPTYADVNHLYGHEAYETFGSDTNGLWAIGQGMWVSKKYKEDTDGSGVAIQMEGNGKGYLQFTDAPAAPRGLESVSFNARLGQFIRFDDFAYYYGSVISKMQNYTFLTRSAFDLAKNKGFSGNASLSLVANYLPSKGCYEARWEWIGENLKQRNNSRGQRLCLYRWNVNGDGTKTSTLISAWTNDVISTKEVTALDSSNRFMPFMISVSNDVANACTWVLAGVRLDEGSNGANNGIRLGDAWTNYGSKWHYIRFRDNSTKRLTKGTYGVLSANCDGVFGRPQISYKALAEVVNTTLGGGRSEKLKNQTLAITTGLPQIADCATDFKPRDNVDEEIDWNIIPGRMKNYYSAPEINAIQSAPVAQKLEIYVGTAGRADFGSTPLTTVDLNGFGGSPFTIPLYTTKDCSIKFAVAGTLEDVRTDIVIDSVSLRQWRGGNWNVDGTVNGVSQYLPAWADPDHRSNVNGYSNFVFTSCWVIDNNILMSAKRSDLQTPSAIRSPLMDGWLRNGRGGDGTMRGKGLGMMSVEYKNAQPNTILQLQIATNDVSTSTVDGYDLSFNDAIWTTVTNFNFSTMSSSERLKGVLNCHLGLHDVTGVMRLIVSTNVIAAVQNVTDTSRFGEVTITKIVCRDEPAVDIHSWWGWNMRTVGGDQDREKRMYISDYSNAAGDMGLSAALNNSVANDSTSWIDLSDRESYLPHKPFVQTPTFTSNVVGEVSFKARKYSASDPTATLVLFGSVDASETDEGTWKKLDGGVFSVTNAYYETYTFKTDPGQAYKAFRLAVVGVSGIREDVSGGGNGLPPGVMAPERVLIDEMYVSEAIRARMGFRNVGCFKSDMIGTAEVPNVPSRLEQPLCNESWGVQCEVYGAQLADDIDFSRKPRVRLHWFEGDYPWGYEKWGSLTESQGHRSAWLSPATGGDEGRYVYRSSQRTSPEAVVPMSTFAPTPVQYMLEVVYYTVGSSVPVTNTMSQSDWQVPEWYKPLDYNADSNHGNGRTFAAFNILDNVAPGWAWINEVNITGDIDINYDNTDSDFQFVEIAQPPEADMSGWTVRLLEASDGNGTVITNILATFGDELEGKKDAKWIDPNANMVFRVLANKAARTNGNLSYDDGTLDGVWDPERKDQWSAVFTRAGEISSFDAVALQLVRTSGIVEHEVVVKGTNMWEDLNILEPTWSVNTKAYLESKMPKTDFVLTPYDNQGEPYSTGVYQNNGSVSNDWTNLMRKTPGKINEGQMIDPDHPLPSGEDIIVYLTVNGEHIGQWNGEIFTNGMMMVSVTKGSQRGTNVTYRVDPWYVVGTLTTNGVSALGGLQQTRGTQPYEYVFEGVGKGASNNVVVVAAAAPNPKLVELGVGEDNEYRPAVIDWLEKGTDLYGNPFADVESGEIRLAEFCTLNGTVVTNLTLTEMYWLDMDPTAGQLALIGGMAEAPSIHPWTAGDGSEWQNPRMGVYMMITNKSETVAEREFRRGPNDFGTHWTPYALRGLEAGSNSLGYDSKTMDWNSVTFKVTGRLLNGYTKPGELRNWRPLRWFVFTEDSFTPEGISRIEVKDPRSSESYGGWTEEDLESPIGYFWSIDTRIQPIEIEALKKENYYE